MIKEKKIMLGGLSLLQLCCILTQMRNARNERFTYFMTS